MGKIDALTTIILGNILFIIMIVSIIVLVLKNKKKYYKGYSEGHRDGYLKALDKRNEDQLTEEEKLFIKQYYENN